MSACGIRHVAFVYTSRRRVDSGRHRHNPLCYNTACQSATTPLSRRELSVMGEASASSLDQLLTVQDVAAESAKC